MKKPLKSINFTLELTFESGFLKKTFIRRVSTVLNNIRRACLIWNAQHQGKHELFIGKTPKEPTEYLTCKFDDTAQYGYEINCVLSSMEDFDASNLFDEIESYINGVDSRIFENVHVEFHSQKVNNYFAFAK